MISKFKKWLISKPKKHILSKEEKEILRPFWLSELQEKNNRTIEKHCLNTLSNAFKTSYIQELITKNQEPVIPNQGTFNKHSKI